MKIIRYLFLSLIIILGFTFACLNTSVVSLNYYIGMIVIPVSLLLVITLISGMVIGILFSLSWILKLKRKLYTHRQQIHRLENDLFSLKNTLPSEKSE